MSSLSMQTAELAWRSVCPASLFMYHLCTPSL
uniref:Uncharacterized protein n=1 Tax=Arundo donax TaxID=35708 RepID=A0A0A9G7U4_ARUDO